MIYFSLVLLALALLFDFSVWMWLRANPVPPLAKIDDWRVHRAYPTNYHQAFAAPASSAFAVMGATASFIPGVMWPVEDPRTVTIHRVPAGYRAP